MTPEMIDALANAGVVITAIIALVVIVWIIGHNNHHSGG